jgi:hypothetical protein
MHKYNNQNHAMMTAMLAARSVRAGARLDEVWKINEATQYHEAGYAGMRQALAGVCRSCASDAVAQARSERQPMQSSPRRAPEGSDPRACRAAAAP